MLNPTKKEESSNRPNLLSSVFTNKIIGGAYPFTTTSLTPQNSLVHTANVEVAQVKAEQEVVPQIKVAPNVIDSILDAAMENRSVNKDNTPGFGSL